MPDKKAKVDNTSTVLYEANEAEIARDIAGRVEGNAPAQDGDNVSRIESVTEVSVSTGWPED